MNNFTAFLADNQKRYVDELRVLCSFPSISVEGTASTETAEAVAARMIAAGVDARVVSVPGASPYVLGEVGEGNKTLLIYDHYDVQSPDPLDAWVSDPFRAEIRDNRIYARGVCDNKGPLMARIQALEAWHQSKGDLPIRVRFLVEGEEEIGSPHLGVFVDEHVEELRADLVLWEGGGREPDGHPTASLGYKGLASFDLHVNSSKQDQHSMWGTLVPNALWRLVWALGTMKNQHDEITIDGLMEVVRPPTESEISLIDRIPFDDARICGEFGIRKFVGGLSGKPALAKHLFEPACTINGISGGYTGPGSRTVLPAEARAKIDIRLVPDLVPSEVAELLRAHLDRRGFTDVELKPVSSFTPFRCAPDHPLVIQALRAGEEAYGASVVVYPTSPGSGPMNQICGRLSIPGISIGGMNHQAANIHGPNENIHIRDYLLGIFFTGCLINSLGKAE